MNLPRGFVSFFHLVILLFCTSSLPSHSLAAPITSLTSNETDRQALISFKSALIDPLGVLNAWNNSVPFCNWRGVTYGRQHTDRVRTLKLQSLQLTGPISPSISNLSFLTVLHLDNNYLNGGIPHAISRLLRLQHLTLSMNYLSGQIPSSLTCCPSLRWIGLRDNNLTGEIPNDIGLLSNLILLNLGQNDLTGNIPPSIGNISSLAGLMLLENHLEGSIPESMGQLPKLELLQVYQNKISGELPSALYNISTFQVLSAGYNNMTGALPPTMFNNLPNLNTFLIFGNRFHGSIPSSLPNASNLVEIDLNMNSFGGTIPANLGNLKNLYWMTLSENQIEARVAGDWDFLDSLTNCTQLETLILESNMFSGNLPSSVVNLSSSTLSKLSLGWNMISGTIPADIGNLANLSHLSMFSNNFTGSIPSTIGKLQNLRQLELSDNALSGQIPDSIGNLTQLIKLYLQRNGLNGRIPSSMGKLENLLTLDLSQNMLNDAIPKELLTLSSLSQTLDLSNNLLSGPLPSEVGKLSNINGISVANNRLSGKIPSALADCQSLEYLYLQGNAFDGTIPESLNKLKGLRELDLSRNNLSGGIPHFLAGLGGLVLLNLSHNAFEGELPNEGVLKNATTTSILGDNKLCGGSPSFHLPTCFAQSATKKEHLSLALKVIIPVLTIVVVLIIALLVYVVLRRRTFLKKTLSGQPLGDQFARVSYAELLKATNGFSSSNLIGTGSFGSVYKGIMESDAEIVAVKVLDLEMHGASKSFLAECETLRNIRHRNLLKILTACSSTDFQGNDFIALVLTYMAGGSLEKWLHPEASELMTLTLAQRLNIAIDVASAVDYLHNHGHMPIVHRDLKPSNVLLDENLCAHVSDFGLAKFLPDEVCKLHGHQTTSIGIKGTIGYLAPEYGMGGQASPLGDVYSYGILVLELLTGKRPTDEMFKDGVTLHRYVEMAFPDKLLDVIDPSLFAMRYDKETDQYIHRSNEVDVEEAKCLLSLIRLGLKSSNEDPRERMEMEDINKELQAIRELLQAFIN